MKLTKQLRILRKLIINYFGHYLTLINELNIQLRILLEEKYIWVIFEYNEL